MALSTKTKNLMRLLILSLAVFGLSCGISSHGNQDVVYQIPNNSLSAKQAENGRKSESDNDVLWEKIVQRPDSVSATIDITKALQASLAISGRLHDNYYDPEKINVVFPDGRKQELTLTGNAMMWQEWQKPYLKFEDINFDGNKDLHLFDNAGATGNFWYSVWLFDARAKKFVFSEAFSDICAPKVNAGTQEIVSFNNLGGATSLYAYCDENVVVYRVEDGKLKKIRAIFNQAEKCDEPDDSTGCPCITYKMELQGSKWTESNLGEWDVSLYDSVYLK